MKTNLVFTELKTLLAEIDGDCVDQETIFAAQERLALLLQIVSGDGKSRASYGRHLQLAHEFPHYFKLEG